MPSLSAHQSNHTTKMLFIGDSGAGKTGALASLAAAGFNLRIIDTDNGLDVLGNIIKNSGGRYPLSAIDNVVFETLTDKMSNRGGKLVPGKATVWNELVGLLSNWKTPTEDLGPIVNWTDKEILVLDSLTSICTAAMNFVLSLNGRLGGRTEQSDWYQAQQLVEGLMQMLYDEQVKCNVIVICHVTFIGEDNGPQRGYPAALGKALPPKLGRYFNSMLMAKTIGAKRWILTQPADLIELKNTNPNVVPGKLPLETGLADYFKAVRGQETAASSKP